MNITPDSLLLAVATVAAVILANWLQARAHKEQVKKLWDRLLYMLEEHPLHSHDEEKGSGEPLSEAKLRYPKKALYVNGQR